MRDDSGYRNRNRRDEEAENDRFGDYNTGHRYGAGSYENELRRDYGNSGVFRKSRSQQDDRQHPEEQSPSRGHREQEGRPPRNAPEPGRWENEWGWGADHQVYHSGMDPEAYRGPSRIHHSDAQYNKWDHRERDQIDRDQQRRNNSWSPGNSRPYPSRQEFRREEYNREQEHTGWGITNMGGDYDREGDRGRFIQPEEDRIYLHQHRRPHGDDSLRERYQRARLQEGGQRPYSSFEQGRNAGNADHDPSASGNRPSHRQEHDYYHNSYQRMRSYYGPQSRDLDNRRQGSDASAPKHAEPGANGQYNRPDRNIRQHYRSEEERQNFRDGYYNDQEEEHRSFLKKASEKVRSWFGRGHHDDR